MDRGTRGASWRIAWRRWRRFLKANSCQGIPLILEGFRVGADAVAYLEQARASGGSIVARIVADDVAGAVGRPAAQMPGPIGRELLDVWFVVRRVGAHRGHA